MNNDTQRGGPSHSWEELLSPSRRSSVSDLWRYAIAAGTVVAGFFLRQGLMHWIGAPLPPFLLFYPAVIAVAVLCGLGPGVVATGLAIAVVDRWILAPVGHWTISSPADRLALAIFGFMGVAMSLLAELSWRNCSKAAAYDAETALRESRREVEFLGRILEYAEQPFAIAYPDGRIGCTNRAFEELTGYTAAELRQLDWATALTPPDWREYEKQKLAQLHHSGKPIRYEKEYVRKTGSRVAIELLVHLVRDEQAKVLYYYSFIHDITERKQNEKRTRESEEIFRIIFTQSSVGNVLAEPATGRLLRANAAFCRLSGYTEAELRERTFVDLTHPEEREQSQVRLTALARGDIDSFELEKRYVRPDGSIMWGHVTVNLLRDAAGRPVHTIAVIQDITERKKTEEALREAQTKLQAYAQELEKTVAARTARLNETIAELEHFSYAIVHDLRAPLRAMQGFSEVLQEECSGCKQVMAQHYCERIRKASSRMDQLITDSLSYSRAVRQELVLIPVDLSRLLSELIQTYPNLQPDKADIALEGSFPPVLGNEAALTQCFSNLLGNAVKFVRPGLRPQVRVRAEAREKSLRVWVQDNGIGIPKEAQPKLFNMFQRATQDYEGTGIGLAIVRKVVQRMGGSVGVESEPGQGSRFWVELALATPSA